MTDLKPPEVFQANDFRGVFATPSSIADHVNRILAQKLKPWYFDSKHLGESDFVITGNERDNEDTHVMWSLEPQKLGPMREVLEFYADESSWRTMEHCENDKLSKIRMEAGDFDSYGYSEYGEASRLMFVAGKRARQALVDMGEVMK